MTKTAQDTSSPPHPPAPLSSFCYSKPSADCRSKKHGFAMARIRLSPTLHKGLSGRLFSAHFSFFLSHVIKDFFLKNQLFEREKKNKKEMKNTKKEIENRNVFVHIKILQLLYIIAARFLQHSEKNILF